jgi:DNA-binding transcriptional LysR family regulator
MDRFDLFRIFARVVETSSFTRAAATLGIPRSTVSTSIGVLEARLGARLLNRTTRTVAVTQDGLLFYERCLRLIRRCGRGRGNLQARWQAPGGQVACGYAGADRAADRGACFARFRGALS